MAVDMFLKIEKIKGESQDGKHKDTIDVLSWSWGMAQTGNTHLGPGGGAGKVSVQDLSITKYIDKSSPNLFKACCKGEAIPEATLIVRKAGGKPLEYFKLKMKEIIVSNISTGGSGGEDRLTETVTLNFAQFEVEYTPQKTDGAADASIPMKWDIKKNAES